MQRNMILNVEKRGETKCDKDKADLVLEWKRSGAREISVY